jgi:1,4-dihydroxy-2-naphthoate octaprenyltransferase
LPLRRSQKLGFGAAIPDAIGVGAAAVFLVAVARFGARRLVALRFVALRLAGFRAAAFFVVRRLVVRRLAALRLAGFLAAAFFVVRRLVVRRLVVRRLVVRRLAALRLAGFLAAAFLVVRRLAVVRFVVLRAADFLVVRRFVAGRRLAALRFAGMNSSLTHAPNGADQHDRAMPRPKTGGPSTVTLRRMTTLRGPVDDARVASQRGLVHRWRVALATGNAPPGRLDVVTRWLVLSRASVLPMTVTAGLVAGLLAWWNAEEVDVGLCALAAVGIVLAHVANNLMNDLWDLQVGTDSDEYPRALYAPHPVLSGMTTRRGLATRALMVNLVDLAILVVLVIERGWPVVGFALVGFLLSVAYTAPPMRLKKRGLGEATVLIVWGPLMVGGTYYAAVGNLPVEVALASLPYALLCTAVLMGKHIDKIAWDEPAGTRTLPVVLGERRARQLTQWLMAAFYPLVGVVVAMGTMPVLSLLCLVGVLRLAKVWAAFSRPKPAEPPAGFPIWPLWFAALAFVHTRLAGAFLVVGLLVGAAVHV